MRITHQVPPAHHMPKLLEGFAADVKARTNGQVEVQLFGSEQLAKAAENIPRWRAARSRRRWRVNFQWGTTIPEMSVTLIPYAFADLERIKRFPALGGAQVAREEARGARRARTSRGSTSRVRRSTPRARSRSSAEDFKGIKIRGFNTLTDNALTAVGASPSAMPGPEVYKALQSGVLDAGLTDISAAFSRRFYEVQKFGTVGPIFTVYFHMYVNPRWFAALSRRIGGDRGRRRQGRAGRDRVTEATAAAAIKELRRRACSSTSRRRQGPGTWRPGCRSRCSTPS